MKINLNPFSFMKRTAVSTTRALGSMLLGGGSSVTASNAQKIATVFSCVNIKANALSVMPIKLYKHTKLGKEDFKTHSLYELLRYAPNPNLTASLYKKMISQDLDLRGNHYTQIIRNGLGEIVALYPLEADKMEVSFLPNSRNRLYKYDGKIIKSKMILHIFDIPDTQGLKGISRIEYAKQSLEFTKSASSYGTKLFKNQATPTGTFEMPGALGDEAFKRLKEQLEEKYTGLENAGKPILLESGMTFKSISLTSSDSQWLESRKFNREEVAAIFGVPVAMLNDASNTAYGNLEQKYLEFYTGTVFPLTTIIEEQFRLSLINRKIKQICSIKFKYNSMLRVDMKTKVEYYKMRINTGSISPNEIRAYEDENGFDGGNERYLQLNMATIKDINKGVNKK